MPARAAACCDRQHLALEAEVECQARTSAETPCHHAGAVPAIGPEGGQRDGHAIAIDKTMAPVNSHAVPGKDRKTAPAISTMSDATRRRALPRAVGHAADQRRATGRSAAATCLRNMISTSEATARPPVAAEAVEAAEALVPRRVVAEPTVGLWDSVGPARAPLDEDCSASS